MVNQHLEDRKFEKIQTIIHDDSNSASLYAANEITRLIKQKQKEGKKA